MSAGCGPLSHESSTTCSLIWSRSKTCPALFPGMDSIEFSTTLPRCGSMRSGLVSERPTWARVTSGNEYSSWPTARANEKSQHNSADNGVALSKATAQWPTPYGLADNSHGPDGNEFSTAVRNWPTPDAHPDMPNTGTNRGKDYGGERARLTPSGLGPAVLNWPSPRSEDSESCGNHPGATDSLTGATSLWCSPGAMGGGSTSRGGDRIDEPLLAKQAETASNWTTPQAHDVRKRSEGQTSGRLDNKAGNACLATDAENWESAWPTPNARDHKGSVDPDSRDRMMGQLDEAAEFLFSPPDQATPAGEPSSPKDRGLRLRLNPPFVAWLMGAPWWWTRAEPINFAAQEMALYRLKQRQLLLNLCGESGCDVAISEGREV